MKIIIPDVIQDGGVLEAKIFGAKAEIIAPDITNSSQVDDDVWNSCDAILAFDQLVYDRELISKLTHCKSIVRVGVGFDNVDLDAAREKGIVVSNVPDYGTEEVADHAIALLLNMTRGLKEYSLKVEERNWDRSASLPIRLRGKTLGLIGFGRIGVATALRAKSFGLDVIFYDPYIPNGVEKSIGVKRVRSLEDIAKNSDFISLHTPINDETKNIVDQSFLDKVKKRV